MVPRASQSPTSTYSDDDASFSLSRRTSISSEDSAIDNDVALSFDTKAGDGKAVEERDIKIEFLEDVQRLERYTPMLNNKDASIKLAAAQNKIQQLEANVEEKQRKNEELESKVKKYQPLAKQLDKVRKAIT